MPLSCNAFSPIIGLLLGSNGLLCWFCNCPDYLLALLNDFPFLVVDGLLVIKGSPRLYVDLVKVTCSRQSHQLPPRFCGRQWHVIRATEGEKFLPLSCLWRLGFCFEINERWRRGMGRGHVAYADWGYEWCDPWVSRCFSVSLGFLGLKNFSFPSLWFFFPFLLRVFVPFVSFLPPFRSHSGDFDLAPATNFSGLDCSSFQGTLFLRFLRLFFYEPLCKFLIFPLSFIFVVFVFGRLGLGIPFHGWFLWGLGSLPLSFFLFCSLRGGFGCLRGLFSFDWGLSFWR